MTENVRFDCFRIVSILRCSHLLHIDGLALSSLTETTLISCQVASNFSNTF